MPYPTLPDRRMPYDNDGTVLYTGSDVTGATTVVTGTQALALNGFSYSSGLAANGGQQTLWFFFPEQREVSAYYAFCPGNGSTLTMKGSNDTTNGLDGTWETASLGGQSAYPNNFAWRSGIQTVSFTGPKRVVRLSYSTTYGSSTFLYMAHLYGQKAAGQTPDDVIYLDQATSYAEFTTALDFGDMPLGTTATHQFKVKNASATHTANTINIQCNDADFIISSDGVTWVNTINIASLAAGASSGVLYVRDTAPNPGAALGPRFARIVTTVASWT